MKTMNAMWSISGVVVALMFATLAPPAAAQSYGGAATGAQVTVPATGTVIRAATGTQSISGGGSEASLLVGDIPGSATGGVVALASGELHSATVGLDATRGEASMANVNLTVSGNQIASDFIMARGVGSCGPTAASGNSQLVNLVINSQSITVTGNPNQTVTLPNGTVTINEQSSSIVGTSAHMTVSALHVVTTDPITHAQLADVVLGNADAQIDCNTDPPPSGGFGTGGGWVNGNFGGKANFGVVGGTQPDGSYRGHVVFKDDSASFSMKSTSITNVSSSGCQTTIQGTWDNAGVSTNFYLVINDGGEPGAGNDSISLNATTYLNDDTQLKGGNIQSHPSCQ